MGSGDSENSNGASVPFPTIVKRRRHIVRWLVYGIAIMVFLWVFFPRDNIATVDVAPPAPASELTTKTPQSKWSWRDVKEIYAFGDSWTTTDFDPDGLQPREENPLGNPDFPHDPNRRPPDWIEYLTGVYNQTFTKTFNLARGAATIDRDILMPVFPSTWCFDEQVHDQYERRYVDPLRTPATDRLFIILFGLVDVALLTRDGPVDAAVIDSIAATYESNLHRLYEAGARHFLLLNIAPIDRAPDPEYPLARFDAIEKFNAHLDQIRESMLAKYTSDPSFRLKLFDLHALLSKLLDDPEALPQTAGIKNTTTNCWPYNPDVYNGVMDKMQPWDYLNAEECGVRRDEYFWSNTLHVTHPVQEAIAISVVVECFAMGPMGLCR